jgi:GH24 family phage-related lysozyme (muramidase)
MENNHKPFIVNTLRNLKSNSFGSTSSINYINKVVSSINILKEDINYDDDTEYEYDWGNIESDVKNSTRGIKTLENAKEYFNMLHGKVKNLPKLARKRVFNIALLSLTGLMLSNLSKTKEEVIDELPEDVVVDIMSADVAAAKLLKAATVKKEFPKVRDVSSSFIEFLKYEEGSPIKKGQPILTAYDLGDGHVTIGYGHAESKSYTKMIPGETKISYARAEKLLKKDVEWASNSLNRILEDWGEEGIKVNVTQGMYDSMVSLIYNMGIGNFKKSKVLRLVKANKLKRAKKLIKNTHITYPGHVTRRSKEAEMFDLP